MLQVSRRLYIGLARFQIGRDALSIQDVRRVPLGMSSTALTALARKRIWRSSFVINIASKGFMRKGHSMVGSRDHLDVFVR